MKKHNNKTTKVLQQGGLMIEALAMLGLISVVTPTMYKKSAERTMEVEDINTASTVRTYLGAAESYVSNNYGTLMKNLADGANQTITVANLTPYLPYGFQTGRGLYDYDNPEIKVVKNGTNLTTFALFPAKAGVDIGQERTTRIASLIGSSGGYMPTATKARGVGGIWELTRGAGGNWPFTSNGRQYSLVVASSDVVSDLNGGVMDNDKYLQRTTEGAGQEWRNTMRTDLYMGNHTANETQNIDGHTGMNSIRDVKSMIINAEKAPVAGGVENNSYGLYIAGVDNADATYTGAYIGGALRAAGEQFVVRNAGTYNGETTARPQLVFGKNGTEYNFEVNERGDIYDSGYGGELFNRFKAFASGSTGNALSIGNGIIAATYNKGTSNHHKLSMHLVDDDTFKIQTNATASRDDLAISMLGSTMNLYKDATAEKKQRIAMFHKMGANYMADPDNATKAKADLASVNNTGIDNTGKDSLGNVIDLTYGTDAPKFGVDIGSNVRVQGVLTAGQVDAKHLRTASFSSGSEKIDDAEKWMKVDKDGVEIKSIAPGTNNGPMITTHSKDYDAADGSKHYKGIHMASDWNGYNPDGTYSSKSNPLGGATLSLKGKKNQTTTTDPAIARLTADSMQMELRGFNKEITFHGGATAAQRANETDVRAYPNDYRVRQLGGNLDLDAANLTVTNQNNKPVLSVRGNTAEDSVTKFKNQYTNGTSAKYNVAVHGNALFAAQDITSSGSGSNITDTTVKYLSVGEYNKDAGVNIAATDKTSNSVKNILFIDEAEDKSSDKVTKYARKYGTDITTSGSSGYINVKDKDKLEPGTIYIRKGMIEVIPDEEATSQRAFTGSGVIQASRFVANNYNTRDAQAAYVPDQISDTEYTRYNGRGKGTSAGYRYDTYMVNPAYTSVMNDIKLTTRGGARLSDILPDFINKGIYVANNTYDESLNLEQFAGWQAYGSSTTDTKYASPYLGSIPAPQCPPGYGKVIAVHPISFDMAQAGGLEVNSGRPRVTPDTMAPAKASGVALVKSDNTLNSAIMPHYDEAVVDSDSAGAAVTLKSGSTETPYTLKGLNNVNVINSSGKKAYFLSAESAEAAQPLMFQQSTYLKTVVIPLCEGSGVHGYTNANTKCGGTNYTSGWAALMGFVYPDKYYNTAFTKFGKGFATKDGTSWYWNIFPVMKGSLEAYATVYCYFDRKDIYGTRYKDKSFIDQYDYLNNNPKQFKPDDTSKAYRERLNDPTLKYKELW